MLIRLLRAYLAPYQRPIAGLLLLSLAGTMAGLVTTQKTPNPSTAAITAKTASFRNTGTSLGRA